VSHIGQEILEANNAREAFELRNDARGNLRELIVIQSCYYVTAAALPQLPQSTGCSFCPFFVLDIARQATTKRKPQKSYIK